MRSGLTCAHTTAVAVDQLARFLVWRNESTSLDVKRPGLRFVGGSCGGGVVLQLLTVRRRHRQDFLE